MPSLAMLGRIDGDVSLRLDVAQAARTPAGIAERWTVRELSRAELAATRSPELACSLPILDKMTSRCWRCFAAFDGDTPVHQSFVELRPGRPLLFAARTRADLRGRGAFRATVAHIARVLADAGEETLVSSTLRSNLPSLRAHRAAGFVIHSTTIDPIILGISLRTQASRLLRLAPRLGGRR